MHRVMSEFSKGDEVRYIEAQGSPEKESHWNWEVEENETSLVFKVNGRQVYETTKAKTN